MRANHASALLSAGGPMNSITRSLQIYISSQGAGIAPSIVRHTNVSLSRACARTRYRSRMIDCGGARTMQRKQAFGWAIAVGSAIALGSAPNLALAQAPAFDAGTAPEPSPPSAADRSAT